MKKLISFSDRQIINIKKDAEERDISFTEMVRRILDNYYEKKNLNRRYKKCKRKRLY